MAGLWAQPSVREICGSRTRARPCRLGRRLDLDSGSIPNTSRLGWAVLLCFLAPTIVDHIHVHQHNRDLVILTTRLFAFSIPLDFANRSFTGVLQASQRFDWVNGLTLFNSFATNAVYGITIITGGHFTMVIFGLVALRVINLWCVYAATARVLPEIKSLSSLKVMLGCYWERVTALVKYGCWVATASVIGPLLLYFDQWIVSVMLGVGYLPFYTVPSNLLWRLGLFPNSLTTTLFPAFSAMQVSHDWQRIERIFIRAHRYLLVALAPLLFVIFVWSSEILRVWVSADFSNHASLALRLLIPGFAIGLLAPLSGAVLEGVGRPDTLVKLYAAELPFNLAIVWVLTKNFGIAGAAMSYSIRTVVETLILLCIVYKIVPFSWKALVRQGILRPLIVMAPLAIAALWVRNASLSSPQDIGISLLALAVYCIGIFIGVVDQSDLAMAAGVYRGKKESLGLYWTSMWREYAPSWIKN